jgi:hypothetical protein
VSWCLTGRTPAAAQLPELGADAFGDESAAVLAAEDPVLASPGGAGGQLFGRLPGSVRPQDGDVVVVERHGAP